MKKVLAFDLDGTLTDSKQPLPAIVRELLYKASNIYRVAIISGCSWKQMREQVIDYLVVSNLQKRHFTFLPISGAQMYNWDSEDFIYNDELMLREKVCIYQTWEKMCKIVELHPPEKTYGEVAEDRGGQVTFSMCGQDAPLEVKEAWYREHDKKRHKLAHYMSLMALEKEGFSVKVGGTTSIDVTRAGRDKAFGMKQIMQWLDIKKEEILFFGDKLEEGENDYPVLAMGIECVKVENYTDTCNKLKGLLNGK